MANVDLTGVPGGFQAQECISIVLIERFALTRQCMSRWLEDASPQLQVVPLASPTGLLEAWRQAVPPRLILFSIGAARVADPDLLSKITLLRCHLSRSSIVLLSDREDVSDIVTAIEHGVRGYIPTSTEPSEAMAALRCVAAGGTFVPASAMIKMVHDRQLQGDDPARAPSRQEQPLTPRETEVLARVRQGKPNKIIAHELTISVSTVKVFVRRIMVKLNASNRTQVVAAQRIRMA